MALGVGVAEDGNTGTGVIAGCTRRVEAASKETAIMLTATVEKKGFEYCRNNFCRGVSGKGQ